MLEPDTRVLLLDALRPPAGFRLDAAIGTTYSLNLSALMVAPLAFAMFDREEMDGSVRTDPIAVLQALRLHAANITLFCQAGQIAVPPEYRSLIVYLEESVYPVLPVRAEAIFHPKIWFLRFRKKDSEEVALRFLCLSRNLTFDRSWDTVLRLEGLASSELRHPELLNFAESLIQLATRTRPVASERETTIRSVGHDFAFAEWSLPYGFDSIRFWPLGHDGADRWPFGGKRGRMFVISPFVTPSTLKSVTGQSGSILLSRSETFDALGNESTSHLAERLVINPAARGHSDERVETDTVETVAESSSHVLEGLHAKTYVSEFGRRARVWTGSANCTDAAFHGNVEFLVELEGRKDRCGTDQILGAPGDRLALRRILDEYLPPNEPVEPSESEKVEYLLDRARRAIGGLVYVTTCSQVDDKIWSLDVGAAASATVLDDEILDQVYMTIRPVTLLPSSRQDVLLSNWGFNSAFSVSEQAVTPFLAISIAIGDQSVEFVVNSDLRGAPPHRVDRVLTDVLRNRQEFIRFLLLLLGNADDALAGFTNVGDSPDGPFQWSTGLASGALLEPMVRAYSRDPDRLRDIQNVIEELLRDDRSAELVPEGWEAIWNPIRKALLERGQL